MIAQEMEPEGRFQFTVAHGSCGSLVGFGFEQAA
jgi:hypothetical protein